MCCVPKKCYHNITYNWIQTKRLAEVRSFPRMRYFQAGKKDGNLNPTESRFNYDRKDTYMAQLLHFFKVFMPRSESGH